MTPISQLGDNKGVVMRSVATQVLVFLTVLGTATVAFPLGAQAAPPTRIVDQTTDVVCTGISHDVKITVSAARSDLAGTQSAVQLSYASTGETIGRFDTGTSDWGDGTFRAAIPVLGRGDEEDQPVGEVYFSGSYAPAGEPQVTRDTFNAGNVHVVEEHVVTPLAISGVTLTYDDNDTAPGDVTFADLTCEGSAATGSLFFTNPATLVQIGTGLFQDPAGCTTSNVAEYAIEGTLDELFVDASYADRPEANASGLVLVGGGTWQGQFRLQIADEPAGTVDATATLERGRPYHATEGANKMQTHFQVTPYSFSLVVEGPGAPAELDCTLFQVRETMHTPNPSS
ncbi:MAG: hypothetical protein JWP61_490 [Friedmanniella sp.]|nr:hypothetical protein [Friedmanniella sp.]